MNAMTNYITKTSGEELLTCCKVPGQIIQDAIMKDWLTENNKSIQDIKDAEFAVDINNGAISALVTLSNGKTDVINSSVIKNSIFKSINTGLVVAFFVEPDDYDMFFSNGNLLGDALVSVLFIPNSLNLDDCQTKFDLICKILEVRFGEGLGTYSGLFLPFNEFFVNDSAVQSFTQNLFMELLEESSGNVYWKARGLYERLQGHIEYLMGKAKKMKKNRSSRK